MLDRETLVARNQRMTKAISRPALKHRLRDRILTAISRIPIIPSQSESQRLLIIRPDHLGDVLLSTPAIQAIKRSHPDMIIHVLCGEWSADLLANYRDIDRILTLPFPGFRRGNDAATDPWRLAIQSARMLRKIGYSSAVIMRPDHWWGALLAYFAGIPQRIGYDKGNVAPFLTESYKFEYRHAVEQNMRLAEAWTGEVSRAEIRLEYPVQAADREYIVKYLGNRNILADRALVCIHPGSGAASKSWRAEKWAQVAEMVADKYEATIVFTGTASESALISEIAARMRHDAHIIAGATSVGQLAALYMRSLAVLGPDSGAMHLAAAVGTPTVALFGPADPNEFAPWGDLRRHAIVTSDIGCRPCRILDWRNDNAEYHPCVREITVGQVMEATRRVLGPDSSAN